MPNSFKYTGHRNSYTELDCPYFWTITIKEWIHLLKTDDYKTIIIESLQWLCSKELIHIYGYVIMPNHVHLLWNQLKMNGEEFPKNSFEKFTSHAFKKKLTKENPKELKSLMWMLPTGIITFGKEIHWLLKYIPERWLYKN